MADTSSTAQWFENATVGIGDRSIVAISDDGERDSRRNGVVCIEPERHVSQLLSTSHQQAGADEENNGNRDLGDNQSRTHAIACAAVERSPSAIPKRALEINARRANCRRQSRDDRRTTCDGQGKAEARSSAAPPPADAAVLRVRSSRGNRFRAARRRVTRARPPAQGRHSRSEAAGRYVAGHRRWPPGLRPLLRRAVA